MMKSKALLNLVLLGVAGLLAGSCASPASTLQTAKSLEPGDFEINANVGVHVAPSAISAIYDQGKVAANRAKDDLAEGMEPSLTNEDVDAIIGAAFSALIVGPTPIPEFGVRVGVFKGLEVGGAYTTAGYRLETKYQFLRHDTGQFADMSLGFQFFRQTTEPPVPSFLVDIFELEDIVRNDFWVPLLISKDMSEFFTAYGGLKFGYSTIDASILQRISDASGEEISTNDSIIQMGGVVGGSAGYKWVRLLFELNVLYYDFGVSALGRDIDVSGLTLYPALGLRLEF
jgi:hypothetical protein